MDTKDSQNHLKHNKFNSFQLNVVTVVDVEKLLRTKDASSSVYMMDNSLGSLNEGSSELVTPCKRGQVINWLIYSMNTDKGADGKWPPFAKINNIVFKNKRQDNVAQLKICSDCQIYGGPDEVRSSLTPVYYYWAGMLNFGLEAREYNYRLVLEVDGKEGTEFFNLDGPALKILSAEE
ncbi:hypothetical protein [Aureibacter tunicatorum]|uniref:Inclusion body protein n=1 Tax=Aureibacter tunicatorum TaxID=866807 RepID=A0AAE3XKB3_9BACT|nr:hypothetical protein [Aureibacter tunicatorum]MDR6238203.1 hypothetical protein [Aureibacter tunicatorum]BDD03236.1 hypothetical protein AUTU_07190 [Aureibacter tunicatorum]